MSNVNIYNMKRIVIIMAGGLGKRMNSDIPKVLHKIGNMPMICKLIESACKTNSHSILIVVGKYKQLIQDTIELYFDKYLISKLIYVEQPVAMGTGNAINCCIPLLQSIASENDKILILSGDTPLISTQTMNDMFNNKKSLAMITNYDINNIESYNKFKDYGKVILENEIVLKIIEKKDCNEEQLNITFVNCGIYCYDIDVILKCVPLITNNNKQNEYYLTDIIEIGKNNGFDTYKFELDKNLQHEIIGVNTQEQLKELEKLEKLLNIS